MEISNYIYLKFVAFKDVIQWDLKRHFQKFISSKYPIVSLQSVIKEEKKKYDISDKNFEYGILGVNNQTGIFDAYTINGSKINQKYKRMETGWIAYNPYRINVGSIGLKKECHKNEYISPAYVVFSCKEKLLPEYLFLLLKTSRFNQIIKDNTTGSVRQNLSYDILKTLQVPLPSLAEQNKLVEEYNNIINQGHLRFSKGLIKAREARAYLSECIGVEELHPNGIRGDIITFELIPFHMIHEWSVDKILNSSVYISSKYETKNFNCDKSLYLDIKRGKNPIYTEISNVFVLNQKCIRWGAIDTQYAKTVDPLWLESIDEENFTQEGDILINSTGEGTIGRAAVVDKDNTGLLYDSHVLLLRLNKSYIDPKYYELVFNSSYGQEQVENVKSAKTTKQTELGVENLKRILIPIPPLKIQQDIVKHMTALYKEASDLQQLSPYYQRAISNFEAQIFIK